MSIIISFSNVIYFFIRQELCNAGMYSLSSAVGACSTCSAISNAATVQCTTSSDEVVATCNVGYWLDGGQCTPCASVTDGAQCCSGLFLLRSTSQVAMETTTTASVIEEKRQTFVSVVPPSNECYEVATTTEQMSMGTMLCFDQETVG